MKIKAKDNRNEMHFEVQRNTRMAIFKDRTKYDRNREKANLRKELY